MKIRSINPHQPSDVVEEVEAAGGNQLRAGVERAARAFERWHSEPAPARGEALMRIGDELEGEAERISRLIVREVGKPIVEARAEVGRAVATWRYYAQIVLAAGGSDYPATDESSWLIARRYPIGVCALITPWNFPVAIPTWKAGPAIAYGNAAILKPAPAATAVAGALVEIAARHLPAGLLQQFPGDAETGRELLGQPGVAAVSFTGSLTAGLAIAERAAGRGIRSQCEMGGQNASVVLADADLERAAAAIAFAAMGYAGQKCTATSRVIVEEPVSGELRDQLVAAIEALQVEDPGEEGCKIGPMISSEARASATDAIKRSGGRVLTGGKALDAEGFYLAPALVEVDDPRSYLAQEEVFAPVAAMLEARSPEGALELANGTRYGLAASVFTRDLERALSFTDQLEAGLVRVNAPTSGVDFHAPFGGSKASSLGPREQGLAARDFYTETRTLLVSP